MTPPAPLRSRRRLLRRLLLAAAVAALLGLLPLLWANWSIRRRDARVHDDLEALPAREYGLVLGTTRITRKGQLNWFFTYRIEAAVRLYRAGKVRRLIGSGDNRRIGYNEPEDMKQALLDAGIPAEDILCDYAGFRTLDSVVRARNLFGARELIIVSQRDHCRRAIFIADHHGIDAVGYAARNVPARHWPKRLLREPAACLLAWLDVTILHRKPHFVK